MDQNHNQHSRITSQEKVLVYFLRKQPQALHTLLSNFDRNALHPRLNDLRDDLLRVVDGEAATNQDQSINSEPVHSNTIGEYDNGSRYTNTHDDMQIDHSQSDEYTDTHSRDGYMSISDESPVDKDDVHGTRRGQNTSKPMDMDTISSNESDVNINKHMEFMDVAHDNEESRMEDEDDDNDGVNEGVQRIVKANDNVVESEDEEYDVESEDEENDVESEDEGNDVESKDEENDVESEDEDNDVESEDEDNEVDNDDEEDDVESEDEGTGDDNDHDGGAFVADPDKDCHRNARKRAHRKKITRQLEKARRENRNNRSKGTKITRQKILRNNGQPIPERQHLLIHARELLSTICYLARDSMVDENGDTTDVESLMNSHQPGTIESMAFTVGSYNRSNNIESGLQLHQYLLALHYAAQVQIYTKTDSNRLKSSVHREVANATYHSRGTKFDESRLRRLYSRGLRIAALIAAGSPYMLFLLASAQVKTLINSLVAAQVTAIHHIIRFPDDSPEGTLIKKFLIPLVGQLRMRYPVSWDFLFDDYINRLGSHPVPTYISDVIACDAVFDSFDLEMFRKERDLNAWAVVAQPVDNDNTFTVPKLITVYHAAHLATMSIGQFVRKLYSPPDVEASSDSLHSELPISVPESLWTKMVWDQVHIHSEVLEVKTQYSPMENKKTTYEDKGPNYRTDFTADHRRYAARAKSCDNIKQLREKLGSQLKKEKKSKINMYTTIDAAKFDKYVKRK
ncbi:hypothetical protein CVT24_012105 [Panaeolus cyanescens]|uniref:Uncharacterized protein n=1 Tax=Panaeolus cyanescens TaxID=181874 RepID=A0A409WWT5_9AGAR|nr:hypothetical protein CVT24_012105 [Panaeolus cyanescens]